MLLCADKRMCKFGKEKKQQRELRKMEAVI